MDGNRRQYNNQYSDPPKSHGFPGYRPPIGYDKIPPYTPPPPTQKPYPSPRPQQNIAYNSDANNYYPESNNYYPKVEVKKPYQDRNYYEVHLKDPPPSAETHIYKNPTKYASNSQYPSEPQYPPRPQYPTSPPYSAQTPVIPPVHQNAESYGTSKADHSLQYPSRPQYPVPNPTYPPPQSPTFHQNNDPYGISKADYNIPPRVSQNQHNFPNVYNQGTIQNTPQHTSKFFNEVNKMEPIILNENAPKKPTIDYNDYKVYSLTTQRPPDVQYVTRPANSYDSLNSVVNSYTTPGPKTPFENSYTFTKPPRTQYGSGLPTGYFSYFFHLLDMIKKLSGNFFFSS